MSNQMDDKKWKDEMDKQWKEGMRRMVEEDLTQHQLEFLGAMARCYHANTGKPPTTIEEIADHWYEMSDRVVVKEHIDEDGRYHPAMTVFEVDAPNHCLECIWLRELEERPDAPALLTQALASINEAG